MNDASPFELLPAIDLVRGRVVRLREGDFDQMTDYGEDPEAVVRGFVAEGAGWVHVVDLDGARRGQRAQADTIRSVVAAAGEQARCQVAGGLRTEAEVSSALGDGAARIVVGTAALQDPAFSRRLVDEHGADRIVVALDVRDGLALGEGWRIGAPGVAADEALRVQAGSGVTLFAVTAIERDGMLQGPDLRLLERLTLLDLGRIIASGGMTTVADIGRVRAIGCSGAIVGRALYEGRMSLREALDASR